MKTYVVVGHGAADVKAAIGPGVEYVVQDQLLGTGDAVRRVASALKRFSGTVLVLSGDTPLLEKETVQELLARHRKRKAKATLLTAIVKNPYGYGRIIRDRLGHILAIREQKDLNAQEEKINEINVGAYCFDAKSLFAALTAVKLNPKKKEYYLTDVIELLLARDQAVLSLMTTGQGAELGINSRSDLAQAHTLMRQRILNRLMMDGITIVDPRTTYVEAGVKIGGDTIIFPCSYIHKDVVIGKNCRIGPFARLRPGTRIGDGSEIGNFTEVSRTTIGPNVMVKHFSFLGDTVVGKGSNIGAGVVTANYDGKNKNETVIGDDAFIGSDSIMVAPVTIGRGARVGAGSVVTRGVKAGSTVVGVPARMVKRSA